MAKERANAATSGKRTARRATGSKAHGPVGTHRRTKKPAAVSPPNEPDAEAIVIPVKRVPKTGVKAGASLLWEDRPPKAAETPDSTPAKVKLGGSLGVAENFVDQRKKRPRKVTERAAKPHKLRQKHAAKAAPGTYAHHEALLKNRRGARVPRRVRNMVTSAVALAVVLLAGGTLYTWYMDSNGQAKITPASSASDTVADLRPIKPPKMAPNTPESAALEMLSSPISPGSAASMAVQTDPDSICTIAAVYNKVPSTDPGLVKKTADDFGNVSWTWTVGADTPLGTWPVTVFCAHGAHSAMVQGNLVVARTVAPPTVVN